MHLISFKIKYCLAFFLLLTSCAGTTGHIVFYDFPVKKYDVKREILNVINKDSAYSVPVKWQEHTTGDYFETMYVYFESNPEEFYQIRFTGDGSDWKNPSYSRLGLISVFKGDIFQYNDQLNRKEKDRIQERFETQILSKIKYGYSKAN